MAKTNSIELTTKQAVYCLLLGSLLEGTNLYYPGTSWTVKRSLENIFGIEISERHARRILSELSNECEVLELREIDGVKMHMRSPRMKICRLRQPAVNMRARKGKHNQTHKRPQSRKDSFVTQPDQQPCSN